MKPKKLMVYPKDINKRQMVQLFIGIILAALFLTGATGCTRVIVVHEKSRRNDSRVTDGKNWADGAKLDLLKGEVGIRDVGKADMQQLDTSIKDGGIIPGNWVTISAGTFIMGSPIGEACRYTYETQHSVILTNAFEIQTTEVTQGQFNSLRGYNPSHFSSCGNNCPVERVNWHEAAAYCNELSIKSSFATCYDCSGNGSNVTCTHNASYTSGNIFNCPGYRLPTEAEWEYAYRAGTTTSLHNNTHVVNCNSNDDNANAISWNAFNSSSPHAVGSKIANNWGLYDMAGNVWEWCNDWYGDYGGASVTDPFCGAGSLRIIRGGSWYMAPDIVRAGYRNPYYALPTYREGDVGFRCLRTK